MTSILGIFNSVVPFADPARPLWRDILISAILCTILYFAPQIDFQAWHSKLLGYAKGNEQCAEEDVTRSNVSDDAIPAANVEVEEDLPTQNNEFQAQDEPAPLPAQFEQPEVQEEDSGPANAPLQNHQQAQPRLRDSNREVGAKKAKSIARRNQNRAYNEFLREQGDAQRAEWASTAESREQEQRAARERRAAIDAAVRDKERKEREARKAREEVEREREIRDAQTALEMIERVLGEKGLVSVAEIGKKVARDGEWIGRLCRRDGVLGVTGEGEEKQATVLTGSGWIVRVSQSVMDEVYRKAEESCQWGNQKITWEQFGMLIQETAMIKR